SSTVQYIGVAPQPIAGGTYENIAVASSTKIASGNINIRGVLGMATSINCNGYELTLGINTTTHGTLNRTSGNIIGRFSRWYTNATNTGTTGLFPIGTATKYTPIQIEFTAAPSAGGKLTCEFVSGNPGTVGLPQFDFSNGFVYLDRTGIEGVVRYTSTGLTGGTFTATYTANGYVGVNNYSNLRLVYRNIGGNWTLVGNATTNTGSNAAAVISRTGLTNLSGDFGVGGDSLENPLPVKLTLLQARLINDRTSQIKWQTALEYNAAKFVIQRSTDKLKWITRGEVKSQGNSTTTTNYYFNDDVSGLNNVVYYRLVQTDLDGASTISKVVGVVLSKQVITTLQVYPNPANDKFVVSGLTGKAQVYDITGKQQLEITADGEVNISHLPAGIYFLRSANETI
ncbi:MAG: T9SS type A sorting domain-containing protein, partial [Bacteroidia bacterium]